MNINKWIDWILNIFLSVAGLVAAWIVMQVFVVCSFKIPSDSMEPTLEPGDYVLVNKLLIGPRLFNLTDALDGKRVTIYRVPGLHSIQRNDVLVFHFPHPHTWEKIEMHLLKYYETDLDNINDMDLSEEQVGYFLYTPDKLVIGSRTDHYDFHTPLFFSLLQRSGLYGQLKTRSVRLFFDNLQ